MNIILLRLITLALFMIWSCPCLSEEGPVENQVVQNEAVQSDLGQSDPINSDSAYRSSVEGDRDIVRSVTAQRYYDRIQEVLEQEEFGKKKTVTGWRAKDREDKQQRLEKFPEWMISWFEFLERNENRMLSVAKTLEFLLWALVIGLILFLLIKYRSQINTFVSNIRTESPRPDLPVTMFGLDVKKDSLPQDVVNVAKGYWRDGERRQGIALLLRASLIKLLHDYDCRFFDSDTESECCQRIDQQAPTAHSRFMRSLVGVWQQVAYAHRIPSDDVFNGLCRDWQEVF